MPATLQRNVLFPGAYNNYLIAGNITNAFAIGKVGSEDDFYLVGMEPNTESPFPILSGNVLDSEGSLLFKLDRNIIIGNQQNFTKQYSDAIGYSIYDSTDKLIIKVETRFQQVESLPYECYITTLTANLYNKEGQLVFSANSGEADQQVDVNTDIVVGVSESGGLGLVMGDHSEDEIELIRHTLFTKGQVRELMTGRFENQTVYLDGKFLNDVALINCQVIVDKGNFAIAGDIQLSGCNFSFTGTASNVFDLVKLLKAAP